MSVIRERFLAVLQDVLLVFLHLYFTCMETTCEKMASGTASRTDSSQIETALRHVQKTALDVWMSIGFTIALYLTDTEREKMWLNIKMICMNFISTRQTKRHIFVEFIVTLRLEVLRATQLGSVCTEPSKSAPE